MAETSQVNETQVEENRNTDTQAPKKIHEQQKENTWGYELYKETVEFPSDVLLSLRNNHPPPYLTRQSAMAFREEPANRVAEIDTRLAEIKREEKALKLEKEKLRRESKQYRTKLRGCDAVLSPIRSVPFDIIREIALHTLSEHPRASKRDSPLSICQVASSWRAAALSLPQLWTTLHVRVIIDQLRCARAVRQVLEFVGRARGKLLSLFLFFDRSRHGSLTSSEYDDLQLFLKGISSIMPLVQRLGIGAKNQAHIWGHLRLSNDTKWNLSSLKYLHILNRDVSPEYIHWSGVFHELSSLTHLSINDGFISGHGLDDPLVEWSSLTHIRLGEELPFVTWMDMMDLCPQLRSGEFQVNTTNIGTPPVVSKTYAALEDLSLNVTQDRWSVVGLLSVLHLPALKKLWLSSKTNPASTLSVPFAVPSPSSFSSFSNVSFLSFDHGWNDASQMIDILRETVNLEELEFNYCSEKFSPVFEALTFDISPNATNQPILPNLVILQVKTSYMWPEENGLFPAGPLIGMVGSRSLPDASSSCKSLKDVAFCPRFLFEEHREATTMLNEFLDGLAHIKAEVMKVHAVARFRPVAPVHPFDTWGADDFWEDDAASVSSC